MWRYLEVDEGPMIAALKAAVPTGAGDDQIEQFVNSLEDLTNANSHQFGPSHNDSAEDDMTVIACCENGYDYANTALPDSPSAEHGYACAIDCVDQVCRSVGLYLKDLGDQVVDLEGIPDIFEPLQAQEDLRADFYDLANFYNEHGFSDCVNAFEFDDSPFLGNVVMEGSVDVGGLLESARAACHDDDPATACELPNLRILRTEWIERLDYEGTCYVGVSDPSDEHFPGWHPTEDPCDSISDNDHLGFPWNQGARGGGFEGADDFALVAGKVKVEGPDILGLQIGGESVLQSAAEGCEVDGRCAKLSMRFDRDDAFLRELDLPLPTALRFTVGDVRAEVLEGRLLLNESLHLRLQNDVLVVPPGALSMTVSAEVVLDQSIHYSLRETATNTEEIKIRVSWDGKNSYSLNLPRWTMAHEDVYGTTWTATVDAFEWYPTEHSPKAGLKVVDGRLKASGSADAEDDASELTKTWAVPRDGTVEKTSEPPTLDCSPKPVELCVKDSSGKEDCTRRSVASSDCG
jgi:hypothetical protein